MNLIIILTIMTVLVTGLASPAFATEITINNDIPEETLGHFEIDLSDAGESRSARITAEQFDSGDLVEADEIIFDYFTYVDVGFGGFQLSSAHPSGPTLTGDDEVTSTGWLSGSNGENRINWTAVSRIADGDNKMATTYTFEDDQGGALGNLRLYQYLDEDVNGSGDDIFFSRGAVAAGTFELFTLDDLEVYGVSHSGGFSAAQGLVDSAYVGFAADEYNDMKHEIEDGTQDVSISGVIDTEDLPLFNHPQVGPARGPNDIVSVMAWDVDPDANTAVIVTTLGGVASLEDIESEPSLAKHIYEFSGNFKDTLGGPELTNPSGEGFLTATTYVFDKGDGLKLESPLVSNDNYSIEMCLKVGPGLDQTFPGWRKIIDFKDLGPDQGLYVTGPNFGPPPNRLMFYPEAFGTTSIAADKFFHVVLTRDGNSGEVVVYHDGNKEFDFDDSSEDRAIFDETNNVLHFLKDDVPSGTPDDTLNGEDPDGTIDYIKIYEGALSSSEVASKASQCPAEAPPPPPEPELTCVNYDFNEVEVGSQIRTSAFEANGLNDFSGFVSIEGVQGFTADGFDGTFLRNPTVNPIQATVLTLTDLPPHTFVDIGFLLAIIDSWDSTNGSVSPDIFNVSVDGETVFSETFALASGTISYEAPAGVEIMFGQHRGFNGSWPEAAYDMGKDPTFQNIPHTSDTLTVSWFASGGGWQGGNDESWAIDNLEVCIDSSKVKKSSGGDNQWDTRPSFGISHETRQDQIVENGFSFNSEYFTLTDNHWTDFEEQSVEIGTVNSFSATVWADKGLKVQEFLFGIPTVGESHLAEVGVEIWYDINGEIEDVVVVQNSQVIDAETITVSHEMTKCLSTEEEAKCDTTTVSMVFMEPLMDKVMAIKAIDWKNRDQRTYLNDGFDISGESLNPMLAKMIPSAVKYEGLLKVTQVAKYSPYWNTEDGRIFEMNSFGSFKQINQSFERFQDTGNAFTRMHSGFGGIIQYEQNKALDIFDATSLVSELPASFAYIYPETGQRITEEMRQEMLVQEEIAKQVLDEMDRQNRHY